MPRLRNEKSIEAEKRYRAGDKLIDIAKDMGIPEGTVRRWKYNQGWDKGKSIEAPDLKANAKANDRTNGKANAGIDIQHNTYIKYHESDTPTKTSDAVDLKTNTNTQQNKARHGNQNAKGNKGGVGGPKGNQYAAGNKGGKGGPRRNKHALTTGEHETIFFNIFFTADILDEEERRLLNVDYDKYILQCLLLDTLTIREKRILKRIRDTEITPGGMVFDSVTKTKGSGCTHTLNRNKGGDERSENEMTISQDNSSHIAKPAIKRVMELEDALTRVQARKQAAIGQLHRMEMDDKRLLMDKDKLKLFKQRISGRIDLDELLDEEGLDEFE